MRATPLQMALVAAAVANGGRIMTPHVMAEIQARDGDVVERYREPARGAPRCRPTWPRTMRGAMIGVVQDGTATGLQIPGVEVGAKTGTAQLGTGPPESHGWMIAFAGPPGEPAQVAVAVIVEGLDGASEADRRPGGRARSPRRSCEAALPGPGDRGRPRRPDDRDRRRAALVTSWAAPWLTHEPARPR